MVGAEGIEPTASSVSGKRSPTELRAYRCRLERIYLNENTLQSQSKKGLARSGRTLYWLRVLSTRSETASLPTRVLNAVSSPSFSAAKSFVDAATGWPPAPWGTSPVGSPRRSTGAPLRYGGLRANPAVASFNLSPRKVFARFFAHRRINIPAPLILSPSSVAPQ